MSICKVLQRAHAQTLNPELQNGRTIALTASVLHHTAHSGVADQEQWLAWCCRVLHDASLVDQACSNKVRPPVQLFPSLTVLGYQCRSLRL